MAQESLLYSTLYLEGDTKEVAPVGFKLTLPTDESEQSKLEKSGVVGEYLKYACSGTSRKIRLEVGPIKVLFASSTVIEERKWKLLVANASMGNPPKEQLHTQLGRTLEKELFTRLKTTKFNTILVENALEE